MSAAVNVKQLCKNWYDFASAYKAYVTCLHENDFLQGTLISEPFTRDAHICVSVIFKNEDIALNATLFCLES